MTPPPEPGGVLLETDRLALRRFTDTAADAERLLDLDSDHEVTRYVGPGLATAAEYRDKIRTLYLPYYAAHPHRGFFAAVGRPAGDFLGWFVLRPAPDYRFAAEAGWAGAADAVEVGYRLRRAAWGRGLATEGTAALLRLVLADPAVSCVVAGALVPNRASWRVMEKCGMARVREFAVPGFADPAVMYAVCREGRTPPGA